MKSYWKLRDCIPVFENEKICSHINSTNDHRTLLTFKSTNDHRNCEIPADDLFRSSPFNQKDLVSTKMFTDLAETWLDVQNT